MDFLKKKFIKSRKWKRLPETITKNRGISTSKRDGILSCLTNVDLQKRRVWENIPINDKSVDLTICRDAGEEE